MPELAFERVGQLVQPSSLLRMGLMSIASAAKMTVISEQVDATVDRFIGILSFRRQKAALSFLTKRLQRDIFKVSRNGSLWTVQVAPPYKFRA